MAAEKAEKDSSSSTGHSLKLANNINFKLDSSGLELKAVKNQSRISAQTSKKEREKRERAVSASDWPYPILSS